MTINYTAKNDGYGGKNENVLWREWVAVSILAALGCLFISMFLTFPVAYLVEHGFSKQGIGFIREYFLTVLPRIDFWVVNYAKYMANAMAQPSFHTIISVLPFMIFIVVLSSGLSGNPYKNNPRNLARARPAYDGDVKAMGLLDGWLMILGLWRGRKYKEHFLRLKETLSVLCIAPPGTGKTTGVVIPTILETNDISMVVNDVKPEIADMTSGYRSKHSICLRLEWAAQDKPEKGLFYPRWNPISPRSMPPQGPQRDLYIDRLVNVVIQEPKGDADPHWTNKGRAALTGFIHFISNKVEAGNYDGLPEKWYGEEQSLPMLLDWVTEALLSASDEIDRLRQEDPNAALFADPVRNFLMDAVRECRQHGYDSRALLELTQLANTPDKERGSILSTMDAGMTIFKNSAVRARTCKSDFGFEDVRGMLDPTDGQIKPVTIYLVVNQEDAKALSVITGLFVELLSAWCIAHKPNYVASDGKKTGPFPVMFVLDEFPQMPKLRALLDGPAVGRGQKVAYLMIAQDLGQIRDTYGDNSAETLMGTTAAKVIFTLTNTQTSERFEKMIGNAQAINESTSRTQGASASWNPFAENVNRSWSMGSLWGANDLLNIPFGKQLVLYQGWTQRPVYCDTPFFFKVPKFKRLVDPANGGTFPPAAPMPDWMVERRLVDEGYIEMPLEEVEKTPDLEQIAAQ